MLATQLAAQMRQPSQAWRLHLWGLSGALALLATVWIFRPTGPAQTINVVAAVELAMGVLIGGSLTGWRATQLPKTRASEFYLITPVSDWVIVGGEILSGMLRSAYVLLAAAAPVVGWLWGAGWISPAQVAALAFLPVSIGWATGIGITVVAYEPIRVRKFFEGLMLVLVLVYLIGFGFAALPILQGLNSGLVTYFNTDLLTVIRMLSPRRLLATDGGQDLTLGSYVFGFVVLVLIGCGLAVWRLVHRLRPHYLEEIFGQQRSQKDYLKPIGANPLSWWTARRVSRFRGRVNLYLGWATILLYSSWLLLGDHWPSYLGTGVMISFKQLGGAVMLGISALQFGLVPVAFLSGLWDSTVQLRIGRLELLLATPLSPREYLEGCIAAGWTRAKGYLPAVVVVWFAGAYAGNYSWTAFAALLVLGVIYTVLFFAIAFRQFARVAGDRAAATWGIGMSVAWPLASCALLALNLGRAAALTPLGGMYLLGFKPDVLRARFGMETAELWAIVGGAALFHIGLSIWLLWQAEAKFEQEIRDWFSDALAPPKGKLKPATVASDVSGEAVADM